jgi:16S rRNA (adenine1518-N6/adenine1519-N6)-dimethyltransferase
LIRAKKSLGQNFLSDERVARRIVDSVSPRSSDLVIEVGPGTGALTRLLVRASGQVAAVEIDSRLVEELRRAVVADNLLVVEADALEVNWAGLISSATERWRAGTRLMGEPRVRVVANLPYYISTPIVERLLGLGPHLFDMTLMLQNEVVDRIASGPGGRDYGYLSVLAQYRAAATKLFEVPPAAFTPAPKVRSAILKLEVRDRPEIDVTDERGFFAFVRAAFAHRRKTILNNLKAAPPALGFAEKVDAALQSAGIDSRRRPETLSLAEFGALYGALRAR